MKSKIIAIATAALMASCGGNTSKQPANETQATDSVVTTVAEEVKEEGPKEWSFSKPDYDIARTIWDKFFRKKYKKEFKDSNETVDADTTIQNVILNYNTTTMVEYEDGGMVNVFDRHTIACYQNVDYWNVVEMYLGECSDGEGYDGFLKFYKYQNGELTLNSDDIDTKVLMMGYNMYWNEDDDYYSCQNDVEFNESYFVIVPNANNEDEDGKMIEATAMNFNGHNFEATAATAKQYISEEDLFKLVANERPELKGKKVPFEFNDGYCDWKNFDIDGYNFSYGRFRLKGDGYWVYLRVKGENGKSQIYKYVFRDGELSYVSDKAGYADLEIAVSDTADVTFYSNNYNCYVDANNLTKHWNGEKFYTFGFLQVEE